MSNDTLMSRVLRDISVRFPDKRGTLECSRCGGKNLHYANCPDARHDQEVYSCSAALIDGKQA